MCARGQATGGRTGPSCPSHARVLASSGRSTQGVRPRWGNGHCPGVINAAGATVAAVASGIGVERTPAARWAPAGEVKSRPNPAISKRQAAAMAGRRSDSCANQRGPARPAGRANVVASPLYEPANGDAPVTVTVRLAGPGRPRRASTDGRSTKPSAAMGRSPARPDASGVTRPRVTAAGGVTGPRPIDADMGSITCPVGPYEGVVLEGARGPAPAS